jgi:hypothetical protein
VNSVLAAVMHVVKSVCAMSAAPSGGVMEPRVSSVREEYSAFRFMSKVGRVKSVVSMGDAAIAIWVYSSEWSYVKSMVGAFEMVEDVILWASW